MRPPKYVPEVASEPMYKAVDELVTFVESVPDASRTPFLKMRNVVPERVTAKCTHRFEIEPVDAYRR